MSNNYLTQLRDGSINRISQGKTNYLAGTTLEAKQNGYNNFKQGVQELLQYAKTETNPTLKNIATEKVGEFAKELQDMKTYLDGFSQPKQPSQFQQQKPGQQQPSQQQKQQAPQNMNVSQKKQDEEPKDQQKLKQTENSALRSNLSNAIVTDKPNVSWDDVSGLENAKNSLKEAIIMPMRFPELFQGARKPWMGILLYGPPGTGKTFLAKACATECEGTFFSVSSSDLISKFVGESERLIKELFQMSREQRPSIIFIDEVDSMTSARDGAGANEASSRVKTEFLVQMQGVGNNNDQVLVLGATNLPWSLDPAIRRRFEKRIYIPLPEFNGRLSLVKNKLKDTPHTLTEQELYELATMLEGYSGSDMNTLVRDASFEPLRRTERATHFKQIDCGTGIKWTACSPSDPEGKQMKMYDIKPGQLYLPQIEFDDFLSVIPKCRPSVCQADLKKYEDWTKEFGQDG